MFIQRKSLSRFHNRFRLLQLFILLLFTGLLTAFLGFRYVKEVEHSYDRMVEESETELLHYMKLLENHALVSVGHIELDQAFPIETLIKNDDSIYSLTIYKNNILFDQYKKEGDGPLKPLKQVLQVDHYTFIYTIDLDQTFMNILPNNLNYEFAKSSSSSQLNRFDVDSTRVMDINGQHYRITIRESLGTVLLRFVQDYYHVMLLLGGVVIVLCTLQLQYDQRFFRSLKQLTSQFKTYSELNLNDIAYNNSVDHTYVEFHVLLNYFKRFCENNKVNVDNHVKSLNHQLQQANYSNQSKSLYLANMSHEMRTPLNSIIGYTQLIQKVGYDDLDRVKDYIERINNSSDILLQKINDILDLAKIEANQFELFTEPKQIRMLVKEVHDLLSISANKKGIQFQFSIDPQIPNYLRIDPTRFKQILINLCSNAIKFTTEGYVRLEIELFGYINNSIVLDYKVIDTGEGISDEDLEKVFIPFKQVGHRAKGHQGTGLGLTITRDLIHLMGGEINVTSKLGVGTIFSFTTIFEVADFNEGDMIENEYSDDTIASVIQDKKILVVEDNSINQMLITEVFNVFKKFDIDLAEDGLYALEMCEQKNYDIIFMDIQMPRCDGVEATLKLREMDNFVKTPIIALTANAFSEQVTEYLNLGMNDYIQKPLDIVRLKKVLYNYLAPFDQQTDIE